MREERWNPDQSPERFDACRVCSLQPACLPWELGAADLARVEEIVEHAVPLEAGRFLFRTGDALRAIYAIRTGAVKSYMTDGDGSEQVLGFNLAGELVGFDGIYAHRHACNTVALDDASVCVLPYADLTRLIGSVQGLREQIFRLMDRGFRWNGALNGELGAEERLAGFLLDLSERVGTDGRSSAAFDLPMTPGDIASYLRLDGVTLERVFSDLAARKLIELNGESVRLLDSSELARIVDGL